MTQTRDYHVQDPLPETPGPATEPGPWPETTVVGQALPRVDAYERVSGAAVYPSDVILPDMLYGAILRCPHAHARVKRVDTSAAEAMPGVRAVLSAATPEADVEWWYSREVKTKLFDPHCRHEGEEVAAVAAESPYQAQDALKAITVEYELLPFVSDERTALEPQAPRVHEDGNRVSPPQVYERGNIEQGFAAADVVLEQDYHSACELHTPMELHGCVAKWDRDRLTVWESAQGVFPIQQRLAALLGLPLANVRVIGHYVGGGFGSKLQPGKYTLIACLLAKKTARPVKLFLSREETYLCVGNRPPTHMRLKAGVKRDGTLTALEFTGLGTGGAYPAGGTALLDWLVRDLYACPNVRTETTDVYTNAGPARPMRAPGHPPGAWALEQMMDALAEAIAMDPVEIRLRNIATVRQADEAKPPYTSTGLRECLLEGARAFGWEEMRQRSPVVEGPIRRGVGMAACQWFAGAGGPPSTAIVKLFADGSVNLNMGASDIGTGTKTVMAMVIAEELKVPLARIQVEHADTGTTQYATASGGSKTVPTESPAVRDAALDVKRQLLALAAEELAVPVTDLRLEEDQIVSRADPETKLPINRVDGLRRRGLIVGVGYRGPNPEDKVTTPFGAQFCAVEVDTRTGEVRIIRFLGAHDSGRVMNRLTYDNQVCGGITMGLGFALTEKRILDRETGKMLNRNWHDYKIPTALDVPADITSVAIDPADQEANTTGAKGLGEPVTIPTAAAVANAIYNATGIRVTETPVDTAALRRLLGSS